MQKTVKKILLLAAASVSILLSTAFSEGVEYDLIRKLLSEEPVSIQGREYFIAAVKVRADIAAGEIILSDVSLRPAGTASGAGVGKMAGTAEELEAAAGAEQFSLTVAIEEIALRGVSYKTDGGRKAAPDTLQSRSWSLSADEITLSGLSAEISGVKEDEPYGYRVEGLSLRACGFHLDGGSGIRIDIGRSTDGKILFCDTIELAADKLSAMTSHGAVVLEVENAKADTSSGALSLTAFRVVPQYPMLEFTPLAPRHADWTQIELTDIALSGLDYALLASEKSFKADSVGIAGGWIVSYKDRNTAPVREISFFYEVFQRLPVPLDIPLITLDNIEAEYLELAPGARSPGVITVAGIDGRIEGFANRARAGKPHFTITAAGKLMGQAEIDVSIEMPVSPDHDRWSVTASVVNMDLQSLNPIVGPLMNAKILSGKLHNIEFHIEATSESSHTAATMLYDDLHIALLRKNNPDRERRLLSFLADDLLLRNANPDGHGRLRSGEGTLERDYHRSQFNFIFKSVISGVKKIVI